MITLFCVRPVRFNVGNDVIFIAVRQLLRDAFSGFVNIVQVPATDGSGLVGLLPRSIHEMNLYGHGVVVGGGNLYENGQIAVDTHALGSLHPPLMLFSLSHGRIYDNRHQLVRRTDSIPDHVVKALHERAALSIARDDATMDYLRTLGLNKPVLGGCPTLLLSKIATPRPEMPAMDGALVSIRDPQLMSIPLRDQARLHSTIMAIVESLQRDGFGPVRILCHDLRDLSFAASLGNVEMILADDVYAHLELLRRARLVVSFRLHAFLPCVSFGTPAINISYDERSISLVRTIGLGDWDIDFVRSNDVVGEVRDRCARLDDLVRTREAAQPTWQRLETIMRDSMASFAKLVVDYANA